MRLTRALLGTAGALALTAGGAAAYADEPTQIRLVEVYEMTPGVSATHEVTLSTDHALIGEQCQSMGTATQATSSLLVDVGGVMGCRFTWNLEDAGAEVVSVDDGGVFHFESTSARLLEGFSSPEASASIESVTLIAHDSVVVEASDGGEISVPSSSTKNDASTVVWRGVTDNVSASGSVEPGASAPAPSPSPSSSTSPVSSSEHRGGRSVGRSLMPILALTGSVLALVIIGALVRGRVASQRRAADAQFDRDASLKNARRAQAGARKTSALPYARSAAGSNDSEPRSDEERFAPPE
ncbi:MAG: hypothetical protein KHZ63_04660 [Actinomyces sp.]|nr:hypothetical protein [Schaalia odontolytica]MBS4938924.1 hypothetical protein [Actinomyces sp.]